MLLTKQEVAAELKMSVSGLNKMISARRIPYVKVGRLVRFEKQKVENWINNRSVKTA